MSGGMGLHLYIAQVGFERGCGVFLYNANEWMGSYDDVYEECWSNV